MDAPTDFAGKRVTVAGLGHFGGGVAVARWLAAQGAKVLVTDKAPADKLADSVKQLDGLPITYRLGGHDAADFTSADVVVASPALPPTNPYLAAARAAGVPVTTEICLVVRRLNAPVVGVTGTKGKSTTSAMIAAMLRKRHTVHFGGNIGRSLLDVLPDIKPDHVVVLELSSFMLDYLGRIGWSPGVAVVTLLAPDHLDWHGTFDAYAAAKMNLLRHQRPGDLAVINGECSVLAKWLDRERLHGTPASERTREDPDSGHYWSDSKGAAQPESGSSRRTAQTPASARIPDRVVHYRADTFPPFSLVVPGRHNQLNAQGAFAAAGAFGVTWAEAQDALRDFKGLDHRLQLVHESAGVRWFNDSIATVPEAAVAALEAFDVGRVIQIVGGSSKNLDHAPLVRALAARAKAVLTIGTTGPAVAADLRAAGAVDVRDCGTLAAAVAAAKEIARHSDVVLLSTGFASYDQFRDFQDRGDQFAALARG
ncbi:MAG TPA: UDP-N-acetylmuramoyl-L-alanine--D-glutamate ligase [Humisphaera sp.]